MTAENEAHADENNIWFNPALLSISNPNPQQVDLSVFQDGAQPPGKYRVDIYLNQEKVDTDEIVFTLHKSADGKNSLQPCLNVATLKKYGVKTDLFPELADQPCVDLNIIPNAKATFLFGNQKLVLDIPQAALVTNARGTVDPELWDNGITAFLLNYSVSGQNSFARDGRSQDTSSQYANLRPGFNIGPWRFRNYSTWERDTEGKSRFDNVYDYVQRNIVSLKSQLTMGDSTSPSDVFESVPFRGVQLASDDDMLPESLRGYAPVVRGIARTNAQVVIRQNGYVIYQNSVSPGAFEISDMYPSGGSGDLDVTIKEADGSEQHLTVPYASVPVLQREGRFKYSLTGGQYRSYDDAVNNSKLIQGTAIYGLPWGITLYGGIQAAEHYRSAALGIGKNMGGIGAVSVDATQAKASLPNGHESQGISWRIRYNKNFTETGTNFAIAGYRYSTSGYYTLQETLDSWRNNGTLDDQDLNRSRNREELTVTQTLSDILGSLTISAIHESHWNSHKSTISLEAGYNNSWHGISYNLNYSWNKNSAAGGDNDGHAVYDTDRVISFNVSIPLSNFLSGHTMNANYSVNSSKESGASHSVGLSGTALEDNNLSWNLQEGFASNQSGTTGNLNADYRGTYGELNAGYGYDAYAQRLNYGISGGVLVHQGGVTLSQPFGETIALVNVHGAPGVKISGQTGVQTDYRGFTVVPYESAYQRDDIGIDVESLGDDVDITQTNKTVVPTRGAVVRAEFDARVGNRVLMTLKLADGKVVPFGATVTTDNADSAVGFIVGDNGVVYLTGLMDTGNVMAKWGSAQNQQCVAHYQLHHKNSQDDAAGPQINESECL
ncbi:fimbria/pilus outer membrane usher protein [Citrobacter sp. R56]|uniref:fimbria/pilus outer membrane usher protein n=1 Tax=Citrobacter sp. R56 TaxID=1573676 RepID=UPI001EEE5486|nr:fimbria/pilus outer membrane usher protein [Citrobacter sp. R56]